jgi:PST family polysaccharide transporter
MSTIPCNKPLSAASTEFLSQPAQSATAERGTYGQILKSSALVGGSTALSILIRIVNTKAMAVLLGPAGFGLFGLYGSIANLSKSVAEMGINTSGVRQIAAAVGSGDRGQIAITPAVLRRTAFVLGAIGAALLLLFSTRVSTLTFGNEEHAPAVCLLSVAVFLQLVSDGQGALIQGMRRIFDLAKMGVLAALYGTIISVTLVYIFRDKGVVPSLVGTAGMSVITSWWYSRKINVQTPSVTMSQVGQEAAALLKLGSAFMASGFMTMGIAYAVRIMLLREAGLEATGFYQSAWALGGTYVGFILQAMGADFYPRLTASAHNHSACNRLVNEQTRVGLLLAGPGLTATLTFAPAVIALFYSSRFGAAVPVLRWICLGTALQVVIWPMGFIIVAKGQQTFFFCCQLAWAMASVGLAWICVGAFGVAGAGMAFFGSYLFYVFVIYAVARHLSGFSFSAQNQQTGLIFLSSIGCVFFVHYVLPEPWAICLGTLATLLLGVYSIRVLLKLVTWEQVPRPVQQLLVISHAVRKTGYSNDVHTSLYK